MHALTVGTRMIVHSAIEDARATTKRMISRGPGEGWLAVYLPRSVVSEYMRIDWETVGRCVHRTLNEIEPERSRRLDGLVNIGIGVRQ